MTRSLALEWGYYGIRVVAVAPGWTADTTGIVAFRYSAISNQGSYWYYQHEMALVT